LIVSAQFRLRGHRISRQELVRELRSFEVIDLREQIGVVTFSVPDISSQQYLAIRKFLSGYAERLTLEERRFYTWSVSDVDAAALLRADSEEWPGTKVNGEWRLNNPPPVSSEFMYLADIDRGVFEPAVSRSLYEALPKVCRWIDIETVMTVYGEYVVLRPSCRLLDAAKAFGFDSIASSNLEIFVAPTRECGLYGREGVDPLGSIYLTQEVRRSLGRFPDRFTASLSPVLLVESAAEFEAAWVPSEWRLIEAGGAIE
jgi:hypothetical protein